MDSADMDDRVIGARAKALRLHAGQKQDQVADYMRAKGCKWSKATVWAVETGERPLKLTEACLLLECLTGSYRPRDIGLLIPGDGDGDEPASEKDPLSVAMELTVTAAKLSGLADRLRGSSTAPACGLRDHKPVDATIVDEPARLADLPFEERKQILLRAVQEAYMGGAWRINGYDSWDAYWRDRFADSKPYNTAAERDDMAVRLLSQGFSRRMIASVLGVSTATVCKAAERAKPDDDDVVDAEIIDDESWEA